MSDDITAHPAFRSGYLSGAIAGWMDGYAAAEKDMAEAWSEVAKRVHSAASTPTFEQVLARRRVDPDVRPVPSVEDCRRSWMPALAEHARRRGATEQDVARLVIAEGVGR